MSAALGIAPVYATNVTVQVLFKSNLVNACLRTCLTIYIVKSWQIDAWLILNRSIIAPQLSLLLSFYFLVIVNFLSYNKTDTRAL